MIFFCFACARPSCTAQRISMVAVCTLVFCASYPKSSRQSPVSVPLVTFPSRDTKQSTRIIRKTNFVMREKQIAHSLGWVASPRKTRPRNVLNRIQLPYGRSTQMASRGKCAAGQRAPLSAQRDLPVRAQMTSHAREDLTTTGWRKSCTRRPTEDAREMSTQINNISDLYDHELPLCQPK